MQRAQRRHAPPYPLSATYRGTIFPSGLPTQCPTGDNQRVYAQHRESRQPQRGKGWLWRSAASHRLPHPHRQPCHGAGQRHRPHPIYGRSGAAQLAGSRGTMANIPLRLLADGQDQPSGVARSDRTGGRQARLDRRAPLHGGIHRHLPPRGGRQHDRARGQRSAHRQL